MHLSRVYFSCFTSFGENLEQIKRTHVFLIFSQSVLVTVDKCKGAPVMKGGRRRAVEDMSQCSSTARMGGDKNK